MKKNRVIVYIDGFNLYFGMMEANFQRFRWLDLDALSKKLLHSDANSIDELVEVKYFTSRVGNNPSKQKRQGTYLEAVETKGVNIFYGKYKSKGMSCNNCSSNWQVFEEKMTDVNIATEIMADAFMDRYDKAILISGDTDLEPPLKFIKNNFSNKRIVVAFPPKRIHRSLVLVARGSFDIGRGILSQSQFPEKVIKANGFELNKPTEWK